MVQLQHSALLTGVMLLLMTACVLLFIYFNSSAQRLWLSLSPIHQVLVITCSVGFVLWVASAKAIRPWATLVGLESHWALAVAPSLFAGITVTAYIAFLLTLIRRLNHFSVFLYGAILMSLFEVGQLWLPNYVFDLLDMLAGVLGAALVVIVLPNNPLKNDAASGAS